MHNEESSQQQTTTGKRDPSMKTGPPKRGAKRAALRAGRRSAASCEVGPELWHVIASPLASLWPAADSNSLNRAAEATAR